MAVDCLGIKEQFLINECHFNNLKAATNPLGRLKGVLLRIVEYDNEFLKNCDQPRGLRHFTSKVALQLVLGKNRRKL